MVYRTTDKQLSKNATTLGASIRKWKKHNMTVNLLLSGAPCILDNDSKYTAGQLRSSSEKKYFKALEWPSQSLNLKPNGKSLEGRCPATALKPERSEKMCMEKWDTILAAVSANLVKNSRDRLTSVPVSRCSDHCLPGSRKMARPTSIHTCCYDCVPCSEGEISNRTDSENCIKCPIDKWPNEKRDQCLPKVLDFISYHNDTMASVFSCVSLFGCLVTGSILGIFISYRDTPIVRANNRDLSYLLLVSIILSFLSVFLFLGRPSDVTCRLRETSFGVFFSVAVSSLLAKTVMVCVAFKSTKPGSSWRKGLSVKVPYTIVLLCSSIQVIICVIWLSISPPFQDLDTQSYPGKIIIQCNEGSDIWFFSMLGYLWFLAAVSFVLAFMVRTLPDTFNEAKYITFSMLVFCSVWIAMIPAYLTTRGKNMVAVEIFAVMASSAGLLGCVFIPKCFIILFKSEMNNKNELLGKRKK
ncbi:vomeronasal type-2 receptor 26-like [Dendropsophus ebraccatus]|uniref:vomeronasal type-2 receptor 26-like n=1 Tax=Dendropsophus ebraccatus TaxID=150705 RepID=UPI0038322883